MKKLMLIFMVVIGVGYSQWVGYYKNQKVRFLQDSTRFDLPVFITNGAADTTHISSYRIQTRFEKIRDSLVIPLWNEKIATATIGMFGVDTAGTQDTIWGMTGNGWAQVYPATVSGSVGGAIHDTAEVLRGEMVDTTLRILNDSFPILRAEMTDSSLRVWNDSATLMIRADGTVAMTANWAFGNFDLTGAEKIEAESLIATNYIYIKTSTNTTMPAGYFAGYGSGIGAYLWREGAGNAVVATFGVVGNASTSNKSSIDSLGRYLIVSGSEVRVKAVDSDSGIFDYGIINNWVDIGDSINVAKSGWIDSIYANHINLAGTQLITPGAMNDSFGLFLRKAGTVALTANWAAGNFDITGLEKVAAETTNVDYGIINYWLDIADSINIAKSTWTDSLYANHINLAGTQLITPGAMNDSFGLFLRKSGSVALTGNWAAGDFDITGLDKLEADTVISSGPGGFDSVNTVHLVLNGGQILWSTFRDTSLVVAYVIVHDTSLAIRIAIGDTADVVRQDIRDTIIVARIPQILTINASNVSWMDQPAALTEFLGVTYYRTKWNLANADSARLVGVVLDVGATNAELRAQYSTDAATWYYLDNSAGPAIALVANGTIASTYVVLTANAKADVYVRLIGIDGDASKDPSLGLVTLQVK